MLRVIQPNRWSCGLTAYAMALGVSLRELIEIIGHDGSEVVFSNGCQRGFHKQELNLAAFKLGYSVMEICPIVESKLLFIEDTFKIDFIDVFEKHVREGIGVIFGKAPLNFHYVTNIQGTIYDPNGKQYDYKDCNIIVMSFFQFFKYNTK